MIGRIGDGMSGRSWAVPLSGVAIGAILLGGGAAYVVAWAWLRWRS